MKIRIKLIFLMGMFIIIAVFILALAWHLEARQFRRIFQDKTEERVKVFDNILILKSASLKSFVYDYTYWDEMVNATLSGDGAWFSEMIDGSVLNNFKANIIWIYKLDLSLVYSIDNLQSGELKGISLPKEVFNKLFTQERFCNFFLHTPQGPMEIQGATIHPTVDKERKMPPQGYFFAGRLWDKRYLAEISEILGFDTRISITDEESIKEEHIAKESIISFTRVLAAWDKKPLMYMHIRTRSPIIRELFQSYIIQFILFVMLTSVALIAFIVFFARKIIRPLQLISRTLAEERPVYIKDLHKNKDEFGDMTMLIQKFFEQRDALVKEIAQHNKAEEELKTAGKQIEFILGATKTGMDMIDADFNMVYIDAEWQKVYGDYRGKKCYAYFAGRDSVCPNCSIKEALETKKPVIKEEVLPKEGNRPIQVMTVPFQNSKGEWLVAESNVDITERKEKEEALRSAYQELKDTQEQLIQAAKMAVVGQLTSGIAHEINNPLTGVLNNIQLIKMEIEQRGDFKISEFKEIINVIEESAAKCKEIIRLLLDFSHIAKGPFQFFSLNEIVDKVLSLMKNEIESGNITVKKQLQPDLPQILGEAQFMQQAILNILSNSVWAIQKRSEKEGGLITIKTEYTPDKDRVRISISDTGIGISKENIDKIFVPFFTTKLVGEGTGLGLPIVYNIIKQHKGDIEVESYINQGATFKISLPVLEKPK